MELENIKNVGVLGSGTMGRGIAISMLLAGYNVILYDISKDILEKAVSEVDKTLIKSVDKKKISLKSKDDALKRLASTSEMSSLSNCDFIIEAAPESIELKNSLFSQLNDICKSDTILATNTSSLSITTISKTVTNSVERVIGMHFFNPANIMKLVEVVRGLFTSDETLRITSELVKKIGKVPVLAKDTPAFIVNRIARPFYGEALKILSEGTADVSVIDVIMKNSGFAMGPFELMDFIGIDINFSVTKSVFEAYFQDPKYRPSYIQKNMVDANLLGRKTGKGFYNY